ncbi:hypothetical protein G6F70_002067 [Rhizopus microsporus]|uniref:Uncharacterized protein n=1 Tax=Rhizopus azygosporus TaxID=86630 RepID=A0A367KAL1_RHIAZ|nr:hypothetical protein G6F71_002176 [Rhizopus microsporus]RCH99272.1 hypothetical protein CU097_013021 [Rhizopus azygosporus]KAG1202684.1 hypothetical protein G6F70_002067 [Rhizopus microsporus]KAG1215750.1 hypothetical protein G6F69_000737 [Rhizopus microsporus]KAG1236854.1 hypothetical protein G6F67_001675 [Rhizopus microsporus]
MKANNKNQIDEELPSSDNPPPYTPHPNQPSSSSAPPPPSSSSPPDYDETMYEKRKEPLHQRSFQGPLGSVFEMVNNVAPASRTTINTLSATAAEATKMALNMVDDIMSEAFDRKEERMRRRATRKEQRREERERMAQQFEHLASAFSGFKPRPYSQCGSSSISPNFGYHPWQPTSILGSCSKSNSSSNESSCGSRSGNSNNVRKLEMKHSHGPLTHDGNWSGDECRLKTSNGILTVNGSLEAKDSISLETNNGSIVVNGSISSRKYIDIKSTNGTLYIQRQLTARELQINMQNGPININVPIQADRIDIRTKNAPITLTNILVSKELVVKTTNAPIVMHVVGILKDAEIRVESTNAPVTVYLPKTFSGRFYIASSSNSSANITPISGCSRLVLEKDEHYKKDGKCLHMDDKPNKTLNVKTTNAPAVVYI